MTTPKHAAGRTRSARTTSSAHTNTYHRGGRGGEMARPRRRFSTPQRAHQPTSGNDQYAAYRVAAAPRITKAPTHVHSFSELGCSPELLKRISDRGYTQASEIQSRVIPHALQGFDILGLAETGSGKTAAFLIPLIERALVDPQSTTLVLAPTRELADQINTELRSFTTGTRIFSTVCVGGVPIYRQKEFLKRHNNFIIGTPGRIQDLIERHAINMRKVTAIVLDEVDYMLDIGFIDAVTAIVDMAPETRQTFLFSATMPPAIKKLCERYLRDPEIVELAHNTGSNNVEQDIVRIPVGGDKISAITDIVAKPETTRTILFCDTKYEVEDVCDELVARGIRAAYLHGGLDQRKRFRTLNDFKNGVTELLVATDVAARGIDVKNITTVINYAPPQTHENYVHRIGRAGRAGALGYAYTLFFDGEQPRGMRARKSRKPSFGGRRRFSR